MRGVPAIFVSVLVLTAAASARAADAPLKTVWDGVYTAAQAERGGLTFDGLCRVCHRGGFSGPAFMQRWREDKISSFYNFVSKNMPMGGAGTATPQQYVDITAYVLSSNNFPPGPNELTVAALNTIQVQAKDGPAPVPDGSLISVIACLTQKSDDTWVLTSASDPVRIRDAQQPGASPQLSAPETAALRARPLGTHGYKLPGPDFYHPVNHKGHTIEARGFLDREPDGDRLLLTAIDTVSPTCAP